MKKVLYCLVLFAFFKQANAQSPYIYSSKTSYTKPLNIFEEKKKKPVVDYNSIISLYPLRAIASYLMAGIETKTGKQTAIKFDAGYATFKGNSNTTDADLISFDGFRVEAMYKYFIGKEAKLYNGFYFAPNVMFKSATFKYYDNGGWSLIDKKGTAQSFMAGFNIGYQFPVGDMISIDAYIGESLMKSSGDYELIGDRLGDTFKNSVGFQGGISFGIGF
ncbi:MAG: DUF3575 domain-containing protein [Bacteroidetes bacterium]|nr:DUF3575 domain-containing protein [Bacteroidota bacterium]